MDPASSLRAVAKNIGAVSKDLPQTQPSSKKDRFTSVVDKLHLLSTLKTLHDRGRRSLVVLAYHRIVPGGYLASNPLDLDLISATAEGFEQQMRYLREQMNPVPLSRVCQFLRGETTLPERAVAVTFDDGYRDTFSYAFPILKRYQVPAMVFVTTGNIESGHPFWFQTAAQLMRHLPAGAITLPESSESFPAGESTKERRDSLRRLQELLKGLPDTRRTTLLGEWSMRFSDLLAAVGGELTRPLQWDEIRLMASQGVEFGSHTVTHPNLRHVSDPELDWELSESKRVLEAHLQQPIEAIAYPIGTPSAYDERVVHAAQSAGFKLGLSYRPGVNWVKRLASFELRRQSVGLHASLPYFRGLTQLPEWIS